MPSTTLTVVAEAGRADRSPRCAAFAHWPNVEGRWVNRDPITCTRRTDDDPLGDRVLGRDVDPAELAGIGQRKQQPLTGGQLAQQDAGGPTGITKWGPNAPRRTPSSCGRAPHILAATALACSPGRARSMTLGGAVGGWGVRTVSVAVTLPSGNTVTFWMTPSTRSDQAWPSSSVVTSLGR